MRRIPQDTRTPPLGEHQGLRGGDRGGSQSRPLHANEIVDDSVTVGEQGAGWQREEYKDKDTGQQRIRMTRT